jgi:pimeloyl-ACP methyl ester carboxylesterase
MPFVRTETGEMNYWRGNESSLGAREPVLFIHGAGGTQFAWGFQKSYFEKRYDPIVLDLPGHGGSGGSGEERIEGYAKHVLSFMKALGLTGTILVGHSMGGAIVQNLALAHPEGIKGIVLVGTGVRLKVLPDILKGIRQNFEETIRKITRFAYSGKAAPDLVEKGIENLLRCPPEVLYGDFLACDRFDLSSEVERIDLPTLALCGNDDQMTPVKYSEFLHNRIRKSSLVILPEAGHMAMMEAPGAFNEKVSEFISKGL